MMGALWQRLRGKATLADNLTGHINRLPKDGSRPLVDRFGEVLCTEYHDPEQGVFWLNSGAATPITTVGAVFELVPLLSADFATTESILRMLTADFAPRTTLAVSVYASADVRPMLTEYVQSRHSADELLVTMAVRRARFFDRMARALQARSHTPVRTFRLWLAITSEVGEVAALKAIECASLQAQPRCAQFAHSVAAIETTLKQLGLFARRWDAQTLTHTMREILNAQGFGDDPARFAASCAAPNGFERLREGFVFHDTMIDVDKDAMRFSTAGSRHSVQAVSLGVSAYPTQAHLSMMHDIYGTSAAFGAVINTPFLLTALIEPTPVAEDRSMVAMKLARVKQLAGTEIGPFLTDLRDRAADLELASAACSSGRGLARVAHSLIVWAKPGEAAAAAQAAKNVLSRLGFDAHVDAGLQMMGLLTALPLEGTAALMADLKVARRAQTMTREAAAHMLPMLGEYRGTPPRAGKRERTPLLMLATRRGGLFPVDFFANRNGNYNAVVAGTSGSGKSVLAQEIVMSTLATGGRVWVFDIGKSYQNCVELAQGQYIDFELGREAPAMCLNPLDMLDEAGELLDELAQIITVMANGQAPMEMTEGEYLKQHIERVVRQARHEARTPTLTDLTLSLMSTDDAALMDLGVRLMPYAAGGRYGHWFEGACNVDFNSALVVLEMESLSNKPVLQNAVLLILMMRIFKDIRHAPRQTNKLIVIDEAWRLLSGNAGRFIEWACRTLRKYGAGILCISQSMQDFQASSAARAVRMNADTVFLLRQKPEGIAAYTQDEHTARILAGLTTEAGHFSEVYVKVGDAAGVVGRLMLDRFSMTAYSTRADVFAAVRAWRAKGASAHEAIARVAEGEGA